MFHFFWSRKCPATTSPFQRPALRSKPVPALSMQSLAYRRSVWITPHRQARQSLTRAHTETHGGEDCADKVEAHEVALADALQRGGEQAQRHNTIKRITYNRRRALQRGLHEQNAISITVWIRRMKTPQVRVSWKMNFSFLNPSHQIEAKLAYASGQLAAD